MIDGMTAVLAEEQKNDDAQKAFCDKVLAPQGAAQREGELAGRGRCSKKRSSWFHDF